MHRQRRGHHVWLVAIIGLALWLPACAASKPRPAARYQPASYATTYFKDPFWWYHWVGIKAVHDDARGFTGNGSRVAIVDTGVLFGHEDLPKVEEGVELCTGKDGKAEDARNGHGTELAGIVGGLRNGRATRGIADGATLIPYKVVCGTANAVVVYQGVNRALNATPPPDVVLLALGPWPGDTDASGNSLDDLLNALVTAHKQTLFVVGSVWDDKHYKRPPWTMNANVLLVAAMTLDDTQMYEVPYNAKRGDIWAPGRDIGTSSIEPEARAPVHDRYRMQGTSAAAAIVAGCAALRKPATGKSGADLKNDLVDAAEFAELPDGKKRIKCNNKL
jgi:subtilisin family serine protease